MKALAVVEEVDPQGTVIGVQGVVDVRESRAPLALWYLGLAVVVALTTFIILYTAQAAPVCQTLPDGLQSCTEGPDAPISGGLSVSFEAAPGFTITDGLSFSGVGSVETGLEGIELPTEKAEMDSLLFPRWGQLTTARQAAYFLAMHGYNVTADGQVTLSDGSQWQVICTEKIIRTEAM